MLPTPATGAEPSSVKFFTSWRTANNFVQEILWATQREDSRLSPASFGCGWWCEKARPSKSLACVELLAETWSKRPDSCMLAVRMTSALEGLWPTQMVKGSINIAGKYTGG